jgi:glycosyltransferase involved in cell wall biosynthesis
MANTISDDPTVMRILYHHRTLADGAEGVHIHEITQAFKSMGHEVRMASRAPGSSPGWGLGQAVKTFAPQALFELAAAALSLADYVRFRIVLRRNPPDVIYKRHANNDAGVILAARDAGIPTILEVNCAYSSPEYNRFEPLTFKRLARRFERAAVRGATVVVAVSTPLAEYLRTLAGAAPRLLVVPNGADPARFSPSLARPGNVRARFGLNTATVVGWAGIFREWHGLDLLLDAIAALPNVVLLVIGEGPDEPRLRSRAARPDLQGRVVFAGRVPHAEMIHHIAAMDVAVVAGDFTGYASPMKLLEYMSMERAVIAPRQRNIQDIVEDGVTGLLFAPGNTAQLQAALRRLVQDPALRVRLGKAARRKVELDRNWANNAAAALAALEARQPGNNGFSAGQARQERP